MKTKTIVQDHQANFDTLQRAFADGAVCLMDCIEKSTGEHVAVICAVSPQEGKFAFTPFAKFFNGNPYDLFIPPTEEDDNV
jgi:hypothetical protein